MKRAFLIIVLLVAPAGVAEARQLWVSVGGGYSTPGNGFEDQLAFTEYFEPAAADASYPDRNAVLVDAAMRVPMTGPFAVAAGATFSTRSSTINLAGRVPHPLYFAQPRTNESSITGGSRRELALRAELAWVTSLSRRFQLVFTGGPMAVRASQSMVTSIGIREQGFPYDDVALVPTLANESAWGIGVTGAVSASWTLNRQLAVAVSGRMSHATVSLREHDVTAGGPAVISSLLIRIH